MLTRWRRPQNNGALYARRGNENHVHQLCRRFFIVFLILSLAHAMPMFFLPEVPRIEFSFFHAPLELPRPAPHAERRQYHR